MFVPDQFRLDGKVALLTAAAGGFGSALAKGLADCGASVVATDVDFEGAAKAAAIAQGAGAEAISLGCDVADPQQIDEVVQKTVERFGKVDLLMNVACNAVLRPVLEMNLADFEQTMTSCLRGAFLTSQAVAKVMVEQKTGGAMVHISSIASQRALGRGTGIYAASKAGVNAMVRELAVEWAPHNIRINAVAPCQFLTASFQRVLDNPKFGGRAKLSEKMLSKIPLHRFGQPDEIVGPCIFLLSQAAAMVTGHVLFVDGGYTAQ